MMVRSSSPHAQRALLGSKLALLIPLIVMTACDTPQAPRDEHALAGYGWESLADNAPSTAAFSLTPTPDAFLESGQSA